MINTPTEFWYAYLGKYLSDKPAESSSGVILPTRAKGKGVIPIRLGSGMGPASAIHYIASPSKSYLIGKFELPDCDRVTFVHKDKDSIKPTTFIANWLMQEVNYPFMIGSIANGNPTASFNVSYVPKQCYYCESGAVRTFNLTTLKRDLAMIEGIPWSTLIKGISTYNLYCNSVGEVQNAQAKVLTKLISATPKLQTVLPALTMRQGSTELDIARWLIS